MKIKAKQELHTKTVKELALLIKETRDALFALRLEKAQKKLKNTSLLPRKRKELAQVLTLFRQKELAEKGVKT